VAELLRAVLDTLLREDFQSIRSRGSIVDGTLRFEYGGRTAEISVRPDGFLCDLAVREPVVTCDGHVHADLESVLALLRQRVDPVDLDGFDAFGRECRAALETLRIQQEHRATALGRMADRPRLGMLGSLRYDTLAAYQGHPVYPAGHARIGLRPEDQLRYAPEHHSAFTLRWTGVPAERVTSAGTLPDWWPELDGHVPFPVHPLTDIPTRLSHLDVLPTLSMRTVAVLADPATHLKLPLPASTLGLRNRRTIKPGTLVDGAVTQRLLATILAGEPAFAGRVLLADEQTYRHADDELLAFLVRRYPPELASAEIVPLAALPVALDDLAGRYFNGDRLALLAGYLTPLLDFQTTLLLRYGLALESHQQNVSLVFDHTGIRLLLKDNDGPRLRADRLPVPFDPASLDDRRILVTETEPLIDVFTTITLHLCAGAIVFGLPEPDRSRGLALIRDLLAAAIDRHPPDADTKLLRASTLDAHRLPIKAMVTAGTLLSKQRSGAADVNKFYQRSGPNYLAGPDTSRTTGAP
jgi:IucA / IucC family/Ferric iron reductase FhuF-like transporter